MSDSAEQHTEVVTNVETQAPEQHARMRLLAPSLISDASSVKRTDSKDSLLSENYAFRSTDGRLLTDIYEVEHELGGGMSSMVYLAKEKRTGEPRAIKMLERPVFDQDFMDDSAEADEEVSRMFRTEMSILQAVDHAHVVRLYDAFENCRSFVFSMEFCPDGSLLAYLETAIYLVEDIAACAVRQLCSALAHIHSLNICHRDVKPANVLVAGQMTTSKKNECPFLKLADFGVSAFDTCERGTVGTSEYAAPEVLSGSPSEKSGDVWSLGMIAFVLLSGADAADIRQSVMSAGLPAIEGVSSVGDDFLRRCLLLAPGERWTAAEALAHDWLTHEIPEVEQSELSHSLARLHSFSKLTRLQRVVMQVVAYSMPAEQIANLSAAFEVVDTDQNGVISLDELRVCLQRIDPDCQRYGDIFKSVDVGQNLCINYTEFVAACMGRKAYMQRETLWRAFCAIDVDETGYISLENLRGLLQGNTLLDAFSDAMVKRAFKDMDLDGDGKVTFTEFYKMMQRSGCTVSAQKKSSHAQGNDAQHLAKRRRLVTPECALSKGAPASSDP